MSVIDDPRLEALLDRLHASSSDQTADVFSYFTNRANEGTLDWNAFDEDMHEKLQSAGASGEDVTDEDEELVEKCLEIIRQEKRASTSLLQRRLRLGYTRAARIVDILEQRGILGPGEGAKPREILVDLDAAV